MTIEKTPMNGRDDSYILITPARNEEAFIEQTIQSVISQTVLPKRWIIVSDGSTDRTDAIVTAYLAKNPWMELLRLPEHKERHFAAKANCFNAGYRKVKDVPFNIVGNLDADITFEEDYFGFLLGKFADNQKLGVAGTPFIEGSTQYDYRYSSIEHVSGACQLFRRECFEEIGGYIPIKGGGIDWIAVTTARMKGWETRTFTERSCFHHRRLGTGDNHILIAQFKYGQKNYFLGGHPLWQLFRSIYQLTNKPYIIGGLLLLAGYTWGFLRRMERPISGELIKFYRKEQMERLKNMARRTFKRDSENQHGQRQ